MSSAPPADLELLRSFVNTVELETGADQLDTPDRLRDWLVAHALVSPDTAIDDQAHHEAIEFREAIRALAVANGSGELDPHAIDSLNRAGHGARLVVSMRSDGHAELDASGDGLPQAFGRLLAIVYTAMVDGSFWRLKSCANEACHWLYFDQSRNRSKRWCDMQSCGNVINARAYRQRQRGEE